MASARAALVPIVSTTYESLDLPADAGLTIVTFSASPAPTQRRPCATWNAGVPRRRS